MNLKMAAALLSGVLASDPAWAAKCEKPPQVQRLHEGQAFEWISWLDGGSAPGQLPVFAFYGILAGETELGLWIHRCLDEACSPGTTSKLDSLATYDFFDGYPRIALRANGRPLVLNNQDSRLSLFDCADAACRTGVNRPVSYVYNPLSQQMALMSDGRPLVSFVDQYAHSIDIAVCPDAACAEPARHPVLAYGGMHPPQMDMAMASGDRPVFVVTGYGEGVPFTDLMICESTACEAPVTRRLADHYGFWLGIDVRSDDRVVVHYEGSTGPSKLVVCNDATCSAPETTTLKEFNSTGVVLDDDDLPVLEVATGGVGYYHCETENCSTQGEFQALESTQGGSQGTTSLGTNGEPIVAWLNHDTKTVSAAACDPADIRLNGFEPSIDATPAAVAN